MERRRHTRFTLAHQWRACFEGGFDVLLEGADGPSLWVRSCEVVSEGEPLSIDLSTPSGLVVVQARAAACEAIVERGSVQHRVRLDISAPLPPSCPPLPGEPMLGVLWRSIDVRLVQIGRGGCTLATGRLLMAGTVGTLAVPSQAGATFEDFARVVWSRMVDGASCCHAGLELLPLYRGGRSIRHGLSTVELLAGL